jgi:hypothetical protein
MPIVYDVCWDVGAVITGSARPLEFAGGVVNGTPSNAAPGRDENTGKSFLARVGLTPVAGVRVGVSGSIGPYLSNEVESDLPFGKKAEDYNQVVGMGDLELLYGHAELRAEGVLNRWETPTVGDLDVRGYYVEGKYSFPVGLYLAARWSRIVFGEIRDSTGASRPWDDTVGRLEYGAGFRVRRDVTAKLVSQSDWIEPNTVGAKKNRRYDVVAAQLSIAF